MIGSVLLAAHLVSLMAFVGGMLALWHAYAVLTEAWEAGGDGEALVGLAATLRELVIEPAMWGVLATGGAMVALAPGRYLGQPWLWAKLALVAVLFGLHGRLMAQGRRLVDGSAPRPARAFRRGAWGMLAVVAAIVGVVVLKPGAFLG